MSVKLISISPDAEKTIAYCARVSNPKNQDSDSYSKLLRYCILHGHWSIFEMANMVLQINTTRGIAAQILRHRSFSFQEFSQRYANPDEMGELFAKSKALYDMMIRDGVAKECARFVLPLATPTKMYMNGTIRSWIHYINLRESNGTQKEHMDIAQQCKNIFIQELPLISEALGWDVR